LKKTKNIRGGKGEGTGGAAATPRCMATPMGRIETIVALITRSGRKSPVDAEEYHDRPCRRPPIGPAKQLGQINLLRGRQECPPRPSAQRSPLGGELDTPTGIMVADRLS